MGKDAGTSDNGAAVEPTQSNRPENTKFKQQKLDAWQPILTPAWVIGTFVVVGIVFVPVGAYLWQLSNNLFECVVYYDTFSGSGINLNATSSCHMGTISSSCQITEQNEGYSKLHANQSSFDDCKIEIEFTQDISADDPVYVYYQIENFYQNHRRYVKSLSESQLSNNSTINPVTQLQDTTLETECDPSQSFAADQSWYSRIFYPCGLIALSVFNDGIALQSYYSSSTGTTDRYAAGKPYSDNANSVLLSRDQIAWSSDLNNKYYNPLGAQENCNADVSNPGGNACPLRYFQYQFLWQTYDQFECYAPMANDTAVPDLSSPQSCDNYTTYINQQGEIYYPGQWSNFQVTTPYTFYGNGCAQCTNQSNILINAGGIPPPTNLADTTSSGGLRDEGFVVWMRTAGLPTFRKLYGQLEPPNSNGFKKGDKVSFSVVPNFLVESIDGSKALVLGTTSPLGGKNNILGIAYVTVGAICLFLAAVFLIKMKVHPRKLGDPQYLHWKKNKNN